MDGKDLLLPPDPARVMEGLRDTGYDFNTAVADIVDNSITAGAGQIDIQLEMDPQGEISVYIADNGCGMDEDELINAMRYGSRAKADGGNLGKFGLGLKTASTAFCRCLSVISRGADHVVRKMQWDLDHIARTGEWTLRQPEITEDEMECLEETAGEGTGTLVVWEKVDRLITGSKSERAMKKAFQKAEQSLRFHLCMVYQRFLDPADVRAPNLSICLNGKNVSPWDPFCAGEARTEVLTSEDLSIGMEGRTEDSVLRIRCCLLPRKDEFSTPDAASEARLSNDMQGFYVYREQRLIYFGGWMGMFAREPHLSLLRVELSFDHTLDDAFHVDIKKSRILLNEDIFSYLKDQVLPASRRQANERYRKGIQKIVTEQSNENGHTASNANIEEKAPKAEGSTVEVLNEQTGDVQVTNPKGTFKHRIQIRHVEKPGEYRVIPVESIDAGALWAPTIVDGHHAVQINMSHDYYQKVYFPVLRENVLVTGMDSLLWALAEAELSCITDATRESFEEMRCLVSWKLKKLVSDLPDPEPETGEQE